MTTTGKTADVRFGFGLIMALLLVITGLGAFYLHTLNQAVHAIVEVHNEQFRLAAEMVITARERALQLQSILHEPDPFLRDERIPRFHELAGRFRAARQALLKMPLDPEERALLEQQNLHTGQGSQLQARHRARATPDAGRTCTPAKAPNCRTGCWIWPSQNGWTMPTACS